MLHLVAEQLTPLDQLRALLEAGWQIQEPLIQRSAYYSLAGRVCALELVLDRHAERRVMVLEAAPEVRAWLTQQHRAALDLD